MNLQNQKQQEINFDQIKDLNHNKSKLNFNQTKTSNPNKREDISLKNQLTSLSDSNLLSQTKLLAQKERKITVEVIEHLYEIDQRKLYLKKGFSSLFNYTTKELGYSEGSACRRIKTMRLCREIPETTSKIQNGNLNLTTASKVQTFFEKQSKNQSKLRCSDSSLRRNVASFLYNQSLKIGQENLENRFNQKLELLKKLEGKSGRQTEQMLQEIDPAIQQSKRKIRHLDQDQVEIKIVLNKKSYEGLKQLKHLLSHRNLSEGEIFSLLIELGLKKYDPRKKKVRPKVQSKQFTKNSPRKTKSRYISAETRKQVWVRDQGKCTYTCSQTKRRCNSQHFLQIDHIQPYAFGGSHEIKNLRLLCASHNQYRK